MNTHAAKSPEFQERVQRGICPYCGGSLK
jgi:hypothetical protein